jgi:hypothetical protein
MLDAQRSFLLFNYLSSASPDYTVTNQHLLAAPDRSDSSYLSNACPKNPFGFDWSSKL